MVLSGTGGRFSFSSIRGRGCGQSFVLSGRPERAEGEVGQPQFIDPGRCEGFGRTADGRAHQTAAAALIHRMPLERGVIESAQDRQRGIGW